MRMRVLFRYGSKRETSPISSFPLSLFMPITRRPGFIRVPGALNRCMVWGYAGERESGHIEGVGQGGLVENVALPKFQQGLNLTWCTLRNVALQGRERAVVPG